MHNEDPDDEPQLTIDSCATSHIVTKSTDERVRGAVFKDVQRIVRTAKTGELFRANKIGQLSALNKVLCAEDGVLTEGVASVPQLDRDGMTEVFGGAKCMILDEILSRIVEGPLGPDMSTSQEYRMHHLDLTVDL